MNDDALCSQVLKATLNGAAFPVSYTPGPSGEEKEYVLHLRWPSLAKEDKNDGGARLNVLPARALATLPVTGSKCDLTLEDGNVPMRRYFPGTADCSSSCSVT